MLSIAELTCVPLEYGHSEAACTLKMLSRLREKLGSALQRKDCMHRQLLPLNFELCGAFKKGPLFSEDRRPASYSVTPCGDSEKGN